MDKKELLEEGKALLEPQVEKLIQDKSDMIVDLALGKLEQLIPGKLDDLALEAAKPEIKDHVKKFLLAEAEKISDRV